VLVENGVSGVVTLKDPYLNKTVDLNVDYYPLATGSGVIVTNNGYILTAFHVIGDPLTVESNDRLKLMGDNDIKQYLAQIAVTNYVNQQNPQLFNELTNTNMRFDSSNYSNMQQLTQLLARNNLITFKSYRQDIKVKVPSNNPVTSSSTFNAQLVDVGNANLNEDMALLKINTTGNLPFLTINPQRPSTGEKVTIYGYPGSNNHYKGSIVPTTSTGNIVSRISNNYGILYYETNADTANGVSGGPVIDNSNKVLGILIYGLQNNRNRQSITSDYSLFIPSDYLIKICKRNNVPIST
ncbi:MAG: S1 family peptidase, partial [Methanobacterium sp.]